MTPFRRRALPFLLLLGGLIANANADLIVLRDGHEYKGTLLEATAQEIRFQRDGKEESFPRADVIHIRLQNQRDWDAIQNVAQIPDPEIRQLLADLPALLKQTPDAPALTLLRRLSVRLDSPQTWQVSEQRCDAMLKEDGEDVTIRQHGFFRQEETFRLDYAVTIRPDGTLLHVDDDAIQEGAPFAKLPLYNRIVSRRFALPEGRVGNLFAWKTSSTRHTALPDRYFYLDHLFSDRHPLHQDQVAIFVPANCELRSAVLNDPANTITHSTTAADGGVWHRWERRDAPQPLPEPMQPPAYLTTPRLLLSTEPGTWAEVAARTTGDLADPAGVANAAIMPGTPFANPVPEAIWEQFSRTVDEVALPTEVTGLRPQDPAESWRLRQAAPLDRAHLLQLWLKTVAPDATLVWLRPRELGREPDAVPANAAFTVPAVRFLWQGETMVVTPGDNLDAFCDERLRRVGDRVLLADGTRVAVPMPLHPVIPGTDNMVKLTIQKDGSAEVEETRTVRGSDARALRAWRALTAREIRNAVEEAAHSVNPRATNVTHELVGDITRNAPELALRLRYQIPGFADMRDGLACVTLPWLEFSAAAVGRSARTLPLWWGEPTCETIQIDLIGPRDLRLRTAPAAVRLGGDVALLSAAAVKSSTPGVIRWRQTYRRDAVEAPANVYPRFKETIEHRAALGRQFWIWTEK